MKSVPTRPPKHKIAPSKRQRLIVESNPTDPDLQKKLKKIAELHTGLDILKSRMSQCKQDLLNYFNHNPQLKHVKYPVGDRSIRYLDRKSNDGMSQKLIIKGLTEYFQMIGEPNPESCVSQAMSTILAQRGMRVVPCIDITCTKDRTLTGDISDSEEDLHD